MYYNCLPHYKIDIVKLYIRFNHSMDENFS